MTLHHLYCVLWCVDSCSMEYCPRLFLEKFPSTFLLKACGNSVEGQCVGLCAGADSLPAVMQSESQTAQSTKLQADVLWNACSNSMAQTVLQGCVPEVIGPFS